MFPHKIEKRADKYSYCACSSNGEDAGLHSSSHYEILHIYEGVPSYIIEQTEYNLEPGGILLIFPNTSYSCTLPDNDAFSRQTLRFDKSFLTDAAADIMKTLDSCNQPCVYITPAVSKKYGISDIFSQLHEYAVIQREESDLMILTYTMQLVIKISEALRYEQHPEEIRSRRNIQKIMDYINKNLAAPLNLDSIAQYLYMDKSYICRLFKSGTGITINTYINTQRIALAKTLLSGGIAPRAVCAMCGFNDYSTFYREFKKYSSSTPEEFRRMTLQQENDGVQLMAAGGNNDILK